MEVRGSGGPDERRGDVACPDSGPGPGAGAGEAAADRVAAAAAELYGGDAEAFTDRRQALAAAARATGDKSAATAIAALRKPTRAAWVVNRLARADPGAPPRLAAVTAGLLAAERAKDGPRLRELSQARGALIDALTEQALASAGVPDPPPSLRAEVSATLTAALADPAVAAAFAAGTLTRAVHWSGFGAAGFAPADEAVPGSQAPADVARVQERRAQAERAARPPAQAPPPLGQRSAGRSPARRDAPSEPASTRAPRRPPGEAAARIAAAEEQRLVREAAERAARDRNNYEAAERTVAAAAIAAAEAVAAEDRLEAEVRDLEERLTQIRVDLTAARLRARRAEAAERRARQASDRLPRP